MPETFEPLCAWFLGVEVETGKIYALHAAPLKSDSKLRTPPAPYLKARRPLVEERGVLRKVRPSPPLNHTLPLLENPSWGEWVDELCFLKRVMSYIVLFLVMKLGLLILANTANCTQIKFKNCHNPIFHRLAMVDILVFLFLFF